MPTTIPQGLTSVQEILFEVAMGMVYNGPHCDPYCMHCQTSYRHGERHSDDCLTVRARAELGQVWTDAVEDSTRQLEKEQAEKERRAQSLKDKAAASKARIKARQVTCEFCGDVMHENALANHQMHSNKCKKAQAESPNAAIPY